jgi:hypothetical protein
MKGVGALVTLGTPHAGTPLADWAAGQRDSSGLTYWLLKLFGGYDLRGVTFLNEMRPGFLKKHAANFEEVEGLRYASGRGVCRTDCARSVKVLSWWTNAPPGDGIVPGDSQRFGDDLGELDLDHISEAGADLAKAPERRRFLDAVWAWMTHEKVLNE